AAPWRRARRGATSVADPRVQPDLPLFMPITVPARGANERLVSASSPVPVSSDDVVAASPKRAADRAFDVPVVSALLVGHKALLASSGALGFGTRLIVHALPPLQCLRRSGRSQLASAVSFGMAVCFR